MFIGKKIKELAEKQKMTATKLASLLGVTRPAVSAIYEKEDVSTSIVKQCAQIFGVPVSYFFDDEEQAEPKPKKRRGCGDALLSAVEGLAGGSGREELQSRIDHLSAELADARQIIDTLQHQLHLNSNYITLLEKQLSNTNTNQKGDNAATA